METEEAVSKLSALAQSSRLEVFRLLVRCGNAGLCAGEIAERMGIPANTLSFHLKELHHAGLVYSERQGRSIIYSLAVDGMSSLIEFLTEDCCQGIAELCNSPDKKCS